MQTQRHDELRDELVAILGAGRELSAEADHQLADAFVHFLERQEMQTAGTLVSSDEPHQPHYSIAMAGAAWGATVTFLCILLMVGTPTPIQFLLASVVLISLTLAATRSLLFMARHGWQIPHVRVTVDGSQSGTADRR